MNSPVIIALDYDQLEAAEKLVNMLSPRQCRLKVGKNMFTRFGPDYVRSLIDRGFDVFLDLKFHDIPNTVAGAIAAACELGVWMVNVHAAGGEEMLIAAKNAVNHFSGRKPLLTAVTILTSLDDSDLIKQGYTQDVEKLVLQYALMAQNAGIDGVVCSAKEVEMLRQHVNQKFLLVTPGIRLTSNDDDQKRVMTPHMALQQGADYLVIGRAITAAADPALSLNKLLADI